MDNQEQSNTPKSMDLFIHHLCGSI